MQQDPRLTGHPTIGQTSGHHPAQQVGQQPGLRPAQPAAPSIRPAGPQPVRPTIPAHHGAPQPVDEEPIALVDDDVAAAPTHAEEFAKKIKQLGDAGTARKHHDWKRQVTANGTGAIRVKSFHGKYSDSGLQYLDDAINEWLDAHPDVEVKFVTPTVAVFEGKIREPALVLNLWY
jgi:hypothetical protein